MQVHSARYEQVRAEMHRKDSSRVAYRQRRAASQVLYERKLIQMQLGYMMLMWLCVADEKKKKKKVNTTRRGA